MRGSGGRFGERVSAAQVPGAVGTARAAPWGPLPTGAAETQWDFGVAPSHRHVAARGLCPPAAPQPTAGFLSSLWEHPTWERAKEQCDFPKTILLSLWICPWDFPCDSEERVSQEGVPNPGDAPERSGDQGNPIKSPVCHGWVTGNASRGDALWDAVLGQRGPVWGRARDLLGMQWGTKGVPKSSPSGQGFSLMPPAAPSLWVGGLGDPGREVAAPWPQGSVEDRPLPRRAMTWDIAEWRMWTQALPVPRALPLLALPALCWSGDLITAKRGRNLCARGCEQAVPMAGWGRWPCGTSRCPGLVLGGINGLLGIN